MRLGEITSSTRSVSTGPPQGCVLSPLLFSLYTYDCTSGDPSVQLLKFADDTTVIGLIRDKDKSAYRREVEQLALWCCCNNLELNVLKTVEMTVDFRRSCKDCKDRPWWKWVNQTPQAHVPQGDCLVCAEPLCFVTVCTADCTSPHKWCQNGKIKLYSCSELPDLCHEIQEPMCSAE